MCPAAPREVVWPARQRPCIAVAAVAQAWCMAMYRDVERGLGVLDLVFRIYRRLSTAVPTVLSRMTQHAKRRVRRNGRRTLRATRGAHGEEDRRPHYAPTRVMLYIGRKLAMPSKREGTLSRELQKRCRRGQRK